MTADRGLGRPSERGAGRGLTPPTRPFAWLGGVALAALMGVTVADVLLRHAGRGSLPGAQDLSEMLLATLVAAALAYAAMERAHVRVDLASRLAGPRLGTVLRAATRLLTTGGWFLAAWALFAKGSCGAACGDMTGGLAIPHQPFYYLLGASLAACGVHSATSLRRAVMRRAAVQPSP